MAAVARAMAVAVVHEDVHSEAGENQQQRQCTDEMGTVLGQQQLGGDGAEHHQADRMARAPEFFRTGRVMGMNVIHGATC